MSANPARKGTTPALAQQPGTATKSRTLTIDLTAFDGLELPSLPNPSEIDGPLMFWRKFAAYRAVELRALVTLYQSLQFDTPHVLLAAVNNAILPAATEARTAAGHFARHGGGDEAARLLAEIDLLVAV